MFKKEEKSEFFEEFKQLIGLVTLNVVESSSQ